MMTTDDGRFTRTSRGCRARRYPVIRRPDNAPVTGPAGTATAGSRSPDDPGKVHFTTMSRFHCTCGHAIDSADEFGDHLRDVFTPEDDIGTDGQFHAELTDEGALMKMTDDGASLARRWRFRLCALARSRARLPGPHVCHCGYTTCVTRDMDDHFLLVFTPADHIGCDGDKHVPVDPATPARWYIPRHPDT